MIWAHFLSAGWRDISSKKLWLNTSITKLHTLGWVACLLGRMLGVVEVVHVLHQNQLMSGFSYSFGDWELWCLRALELESFGACGLWTFWASEHLSLWAWELLGFGESELERFRALEFEIIGAWEHWSLSSRACISGVTS